MRNPVLFLMVCCFVASTADVLPSRQAVAANGKKIVFIAGPKSHGYGAHEHYAGCVLLAESLEANLPGYECEVVKDGFPKDLSVFDNADAVVCFADGGGRHPFNPHLKTIDELAEKGVGIGCIHYAVETLKGNEGIHFARWMGGYFEPHWSVNPHWTANFEKLPEHEVTQGVNPFDTHDEWYYHMRFREEMTGVTPLLTDMPGPETLRRRDGAHSGNPHVRAAVLERKEPQHVMWLSKNDNQRGFGCTGGHFHWNWGHDDFRKIVLNAIVWIANGTVPANGVTDKPVTYERLLPNQDYDPPAKFNRDAIIERFKLKSSA
jgi:type 1 glutamine amidotransferase